MLCIVECAVKALTRSCIYCLLTLHNTRIADSRALLQPNLFCRHMPALCGIISAGTAREKLHWKGSSEQEAREIFPSRKSLAISVSGQAASMP